MPRALEKRLLGFLRAGYRENLNGYFFTNRNGNPYSIGKVTEYGLWPALQKLKIERAGLHAFRHAAASCLSKAHRSRWYNASYVIATLELLFRSTGMLWVTRRGGPWRRWPRTSNVMPQLNWSQVLKWSQVSRK